MNIVTNDFVVVNHKNGKNYDGRVVKVMNLPKGLLFTVQIPDHATGTVKYRSLYANDCVSVLKVEDEGLVSATR